MPPSLRERKAPEKEKGGTIDTTTTRKRAATSNSVPQSPVTAKSPAKKKARPESVINVQSRRSSRSAPENAPAQDDSPSKPRDKKQQQEGQREDTGRTTRAKAWNERKIRAVVKDNLLIISGIPAERFPTITQTSTKEEEEENASSPTHDSDEGAGPSRHPSLTELYAKHLPHKLEQVPHPYKLYLKRACPENASPATNGVEEKDDRHLNLNQLAAKHIPHKLKSAPFPYPNVSPPSTQVEPQGDAPEGPPRKRRKVDWANKTAGLSRRSLRSDLQNEPSAVLSDNSQHSQVHHLDDSMQDEAIETEDEGDASHDKDAIADGSEAQLPSLDASQTTLDPATQGSHPSLQPSLTKTSFGSNETFYDAMSPPGKPEASTKPNATSAAKPNGQTSEAAPLTPPSTTPLPPAKTYQTKRTSPALPPGSPNILPPEALPEPYQPLPAPLPPRSSFPSEADYLHATIYPRLSDTAALIAALSSHLPSTRTTETLLALAENTQSILQAWQDEYVALEKITAPASGSNGRKHATGGRAHIDPPKFDDDHEKELYGNGSILAKYKPRYYVPPPPGHAASRAVSASVAAAAGGASQTEGRELRRRRADLATEGVAASDDDAVHEGGKRKRKPVQRFEDKLNADATTTRESAGTSTSRKPGATGNPAAPPPSKRGRLSALQNSFGAGTDTDTAASPAPGDDELSEDVATDADYPAPAPAVQRNIPHANPMSKRRAPTTAASTSTTPVKKTVVANSSAAASATKGTNYATTSGSPGGTSNTSPEGKEPRKQRQKSEKRSESMTAWWAERKRKQAEMKKAQQEQSARDMAAGQRPRDEVPFSPFNQGVGGGAKARY